MTSLGGATPMQAKRIKIDLGNAVRVLLIATIQMQLSNESIVDEHSNSVLAFVSSRSNGNALT